MRLRSEAYPPLFHCRLTFEMGETPITRMKQVAQFGLLLGSFLCCTVVFALEIGLRSTPYDTVDSMGHGMGFNDPFRAEHYGIMASNIGIKGFLEYENHYSGTLLAAHLVGFVVIFLTGRKEWLWTRWYFAIQGFIFPLGWIGLFFLPFNVSAIASGSLDREAAIDLPFTTMITNPVWFITASAVFFMIRSDLIRSHRKGKAVCENTVVEPASIA